MKSKKFRKIILLLTALLLITTSCSSDTETSKTPDTTKSIVTTKAETEKEENVVKITKDDIEVSFFGAEPLITAAINAKSVSKKLDPLFFSSPDVEVVNLSEMFPLYTQLKVGESFQVKLSEEWLETYEKILIGRDIANPLSFGEAKDITYLLDDNMNFTVPDEFDSYLYKKEQWTSELETFIQDKIDLAFSEDSRLLSSIAKASGVKKLSDCALSIDKAFFLIPKKIELQSSPGNVGTYNVASTYTFKPYYLILICKMSGTTSNGETIDGYIPLTGSNPTENSENSESTIGGKTEFERYGKYKLNFGVSNKITPRLLTQEEDIFSTDISFYETKLETFKEDYTIINVK